MILFVGGLICAGLLFTGAAPEALLGLPVGFWGWVGASALGAILIYFNRRPGN